MLAEKAKESEERVEVLEADRRFRASRLTIVLFLRVAGFMV